MNLAQRVTLLAQAVAADVKALFATRGDLSQLTTTAKNTIVAALNELQSEINAVAAGTGNIDDGSATNSTTTTYSANQINIRIGAAISALIDNAPDALNTLLELANELTSQDAALDNLLTAVGNRVGVDTVQSFTAEQQATARGNIGAASAAALTALATAVGDTDHDFVSEYNTAKA